MSGGEKLINPLNSLNISEVLQQFLENTMTPCFKYYSLETSRIRILALQSSANLLVEYENVQVSQQNHMTEIGYVLYSNM